MKVAFPFGYPAPTAFYLTVYVLTFVVHQIFMHYVLAGSLYVTWSTIWPGRDAIPRAEQPLAATLRDWMPFLLSAAITAGIAPLLFIQIVYQRQFYTANLLLWWRWMLVVPVLIGAFYLLYLIKSSRLWTWPYAVRVAVTLGASLSFIFVGFCWTVNHLLASSAADWPDIYVSGRMPFVASALISRLLIWIGGSFATMSVIVGWQLYYRQEFGGERSGSGEVPFADARGSAGTLARLTCGGLVVAVVAGIAYVAQCDEQSQQVVFGRSVLPYLLIAAVGMVAQGIGWSNQWRLKKFGAVGLTLASVGTALGILGVSVVREGLRVRAIDLASLAQRHSDAATVGGFTVFLVAAVLVSLLIIWCVRLVQSGINSKF